MPFLLIRIPSSYFKFQPFNFSLSSPPRGEQVGGIRVDQEVTIEESEVPDSLKIVIYRVTQEAMNNSAKHSKANLVRLCLRKIDGRMELAVEDNGRGFDQEKAFGSESTRRGLGLTGMRERVELSGGSFKIESAEGKGTIIRASWPL
jgi:signal transduction histidine kinase